MIKFINKIFTIIVCDKKFLQFKKIYRYYCAHVYKNTNAMIVALIFVRFKGRIQIQTDLTNSTKNRTEQFSSNQMVF